VTSRKGAQYQGVLNMLMLLLPGGAMSYYGDEIGLLQLDLPYDQVTDLLARNVGPVSSRSYVASLTCAFYIV